MANDYAWTVETLYLRRPTPEYSQAFDLAAGALRRAEGPALAVVSSAVYAVELLKRCPGALDFATTSSFDAADLVAAAQGWAWGPIKDVEFSADLSAYDSIVWAEPERASAEDLARTLRSRARTGARLEVIATTYLRRFLPLWRAHPVPAIRPLNPGRVMHLLRDSGWQVESCLPFHGPRSIAWGKLAQLADALGRPDLGDRCLFAMRSNYREPGWLWPFAPLTLIRARAI